MNALNDDLIKVEQAIKALVTTQSKTLSFFDDDQHTTLLICILALTATLENSMRKQLPLL